MSKRAGCLWLAVICIGFTAVSLLLQSAGVIPNNATRTARTAIAADVTRAPTETPRDTATEAPTATITDTPTITSTPRPTDTPTPMPYTEASYVRTISDGLFITAGGRNFGSIRVADGRENGGERVVIVTYYSTENTESGRVDEVFDIFSGIAATIRTQGLDVDSVILISGNSLGQATASFAATAPDLVAWSRGEITRQLLAQRIITEDF